MSKLKVMASYLGGVGAFANRNYKFGETITEIRGNVIHWRTVLSLGGVIQDNTFRFSAEYYLSPDGMGNYLNHSCDPNAGIYKEQGKLFLKSIRQITFGEEVVFDYSTILGDDDIWTMKCRCGTSFCRNIIKNFGSLPERIQAKYFFKGMVHSAIIKTLKKIPVLGATGIRNGDQVEGER